MTSPSQTWRKVRVAHQGVNFFSTSPEHCKKSSAEDGWYDVKWTPDACFDFTQLDPRIFASNADRNEHAIKNPLIASIYLGHYGLFRQIIEVCGFSVLLAPVGDRCVTPLHVLAAVNTSQPANKVLIEFVNSLVGLSVTQATKEHYFREGRTVESVFGSLKAIPLLPNGTAASGYPEEVGITPLELRPSLKNEFTSL